MFDTLIEWFWKLFYLLEMGICRLVQIVYDLFEVFAGLDYVTYQGEKSILLDVFFGHSTITSVYWAMAAIGVVLCFAFTIIAVIKKMFDIEEKEQRTLGMIVYDCGKTIIMIAVLNFLIIAAVNASNLLIKQIDYAVSGYSTLDENENHTIHFEDEDFATMARIYNTIGNYALNPSYNNRYNINNCFNDIREDMYILQLKGVFDYDYKTPDGVENWQSVLVPIARAQNLRKDVHADKYNASLVAAMTHAMEVLQTNSNFYPLSEYRSTDITLTSKNTRIDAVLMVMGTTNAARNEYFNENASMHDNLRHPYVNGYKDMYDLDVVANDFYYSGMDYVVVYISAIFIGYQFLFICINCIARIFNMLLLYIVAPLFMGISPIDNGGKMKQWTTAFIVQSFSVFGSVLAMRLLLLYIPIILSDELEIFDSGLANFVAKIILILAGALTANKASSLISGILADNAGMQAIYAGDTAKEVVGDMKKAYDMFSGKDKKNDDKKEGSKDAKGGAGGIGGGLKSLGEMGERGEAIMEEGTSDTPDNQDNSRSNNLDLGEKDSGTDGPGGMTGGMGNLSAGMLGGIGGSQISEEDQETAMVVGAAVVTGGTSAAGTSAAGGSTGAVGSTGSMGGMDVMGSGSDGFGKGLGGDSPDNKKSENSEKSKGSKEELNQDKGMLGVTKMTGEGLGKAGQGMSQTMSTNKSGSMSSGDSNSSKKLKAPPGRMRSRGVSPTSRSEGRSQSGGRQNSKSGSTTKTGPDLKSPPKNYNNKNE